MDPEPFTPSTYGDRIADVYDNWFPTVDPQPAIDALTELAHGGPVLELGIGTGRLALPLAAGGVPVEGIDASAAMVEKLRAKPGGDAIPVTIGDFADVPRDGPFALVFVAFTTFFGLTTQESQLRCFRNVAARLRDGGVFVIEAFVPDVARFDRGQTVRALAVGVDHARLAITRHDAATQRITSQHVHLARDEIEMYPVQLRYAWPSELDLMARLAGLELKHRWGGWDCSPFTSDSGMHVSVYRRADAAETGDSA